MTQGNFQFNNSIINEIFNFTTSQSDVLFLTGPIGSAKSEAIEYIAPKLAQDHLVFRHFCFENSVIDDFLLNFYDGLRDFSLAKKISLKKFIADNLKEKVTHYFKAIEKKSIVIIENFENIENNGEILDFICHIANYPNIKIIIVSQNPQKNLFRFRNIRTKNIQTEQNIREIFQKKLENITDNNELIQNFYSISKARELFLEMSLKFLTITDISFEDLIKEFEKRNKSNQLDFGEFLVAKFIALTPKKYIDFFKILSFLNHPVSNEFITNYKIGNCDYIDYLAKNYLINFFKSEIYVKDCFKRYVLSQISDQERFIQYKKFIEIYEIELTKPPIERLLRLSRESIRKEIESFKKQTPVLALSSQNSSVSSSNASLNQNFSYLNMSKKTKEENILKLSQKLKKIKERKENLENKTFLTKITGDYETRKNNEEKEKIKQDIIKKINISEKLKENYNYKESIEILKQAYDIAVEFKNSDIEKGSEDFIIEIIALIAKNYECLSDYNHAQQYYLKASKIADEIKDSRRFEIKYKIALCDKNLFRTQEAKINFTQITNIENVSAKYKAMSYIELGEIYELESKAQEAKDFYLKAIPFVIGENKKLAAKCYYKLAMLYDENGDIPNASKYYQKNYALSSSKEENEYYSICLNNLAIINFEQGKYEDSLRFLKLALNYDTETNDIENMYFTQKELARAYSKIDENEMENYYKKALKSAEILKDDFKKALVFFEKGEYYYDKNNDKLAIENFISAKEIFKNQKDNEENIKRIDIRIKDIEKRTNNAS